MADIIVIDYSNATETLTAIARQPFNLTTLTLADTATGYLASSTADEIGGALYIVDSGNVAISNTIGSGGARPYLYISEDGDGTATAIWSATAPTWDPSKNGFYTGTDKAICQAIESATAGTYIMYYYNRSRDLHLDNLKLTNSAIIDSNLTVGGAADIGGNGDIGGNADIGGITTATIGGMGQRAVLANFDSGDDQDDVYQFVADYFGSNYFSGSFTTPSGWSALRQYMAGGLFFNDTGSGTFRTEVVKGFTFNAAQLVLSTSLVGELTTGTNPLASHTYANGSSTPLVSTLQLILPANQAPS